MDHQKSNFLLIFDPLSAGGCWGRPMLPFWKLVDETQISTPPELTRHHNSIKLWILLPLRADLFPTLQYEIPCSVNLSQISRLHVNWRILVKSRSKKYRCIWNTKIGECIFVRTYKIWENKLASSQNIKPLKPKQQKIRAQIRFPKGLKNIPFKLREYPIFHA